MKPNLSPSEAATAAGDANPPAHRRIHIDHPAVVISSVVPCSVPNVPAVLSAFQAEVHPGDNPSTEGPRRFLIQFSRWGPQGVPEESLLTLATAVFPREGVQRLAEICRDHGLVLIKGIPTLFNAARRERIVFDYAAVVSGLVDTPPSIQDVYTFGVRQNAQQPLIVCGCSHHRDGAGVR